MNVDGLTIAVTGGAGYLGSAVSAALLFAGARVRIVDALLFGATPIASLTRHRSCDLLIGDIRDAAFLSRAFDGVDAVVHLAAIVGESACATDEEAAWEINADGTRLALDAFERSNDGLFLFVSTCSNYGIAEEALATERTPLNPLSQYARAKIAAEQHVLRARGAACVLRFGTLCGLSARMRFDLLVNEMARASATGRTIEIFGLDAWRPLLEIDDAARAIASCLAAPAAVAGRVFNVASENVQKRALVDLVRAYYPDTRLAIAGTRRDARNYRVCTAQIRDTLGFEPARTVEQALTDVSQAVTNGFFRDPFSAEHSAIPDRSLRWPAESAAAAAREAATGGRACALP